MGLESVSLLIKSSRLRWFGHVECKHDANRGKQCMMMDTDRTSAINLVCEKLAFLACAKRIILRI